jgi:iron complex outermembrane receptor protein
LTIIAHMGWTVKYTRPFLVILLMTVSCIHVLGQSKISGQVVEAVSGNPLPAVNIILNVDEEVPTVWFTNSDGRFEFQSLLKPSVLEFRFVGYRTMTLEVDSDTPMPLRVSMERSRVLLNSAVVSASRFEENFSELTVSMDVIRPELIQQRNITTLDAALREVPGLIIVDNEPQIRSGSGYSFGAGSRVQVLLDGIPQLSGDIGRPAWDNLPMEAVERIEVIKGASSVLYGSAALSGVVGAYTAYPKDTSYTRVEFFGGAYALPESDANRYWNSNPQIHGRTFYHSRGGTKDDLMFSANLVSDDGHLGPFRDSTGTIIRDSDAFSTKRYAADRRGRLWMKWRHRNQADEGLTYGIIAQGQYSASVQTLIWDNIDDGLFGAFEGSATSTLQTVWNIGPFLEKRWADGHALTLRSNWNHLENENDNDQSNDSESFFHEAQFRWDGSSAGLDVLDVTTGVAFGHVYSESQLYDLGGLDPIHRSENAGVYAQVDLRPREGTNISAGIRQEWFQVDGDANSRPVFRAGLNQKLAEASFLRVSYGQGFRFPTIGERFISTAVGALSIYPNPELQAESSDNLEIGFKQGFRIGSMEGYADVAVFRQNYEDFIEFSFGQWGDPFTDPLFGLGFTSLNTGKARVDGLELVFAGRHDILSDRSISFLAGYTYTEPISLTPDQPYGPEDDIGETTFLSSSSDPSGDILKYRMQHLARLNIDVQWGRWTTGVGVRYNSFMQNIDAVFEQLDDEFLGLPTGLRRWRMENDQGDAIFDLRMGYRFWKSNTIDLVVDNLLNRHYSIRPLVLESTRRVILRMRVEF